MINSRDINDLKPAAREKCLKLIEVLSEKGIEVKVIQTLRDEEYQKFLYMKGRNKVPGEKIVTNCDGYKKKSAHQSGMAWDMVPLDKNCKINWNDLKAFKIMADEAVKLGIVAGYYFKSLKDCPHFELKGIK